MRSAMISARVTCRGPSVAKWPGWKSSKVSSMRKSCGLEAGGGTDCVNNPIIAAIIGDENAENQIRGSSL